jgi:hypothetical protein
MKTFFSILSFALVLSLQPMLAAPTRSQTPDHGGIIEMKYDGFTRETVVSLRKMSVSCAGLKGNFTDACVYMAVSLHCPGIQLNSVRYVMLQVIFETKNWGERHPLDQRELTAVADTTTLRFGRMRLVSLTNVPMTETLEIAVPYQMYKKIADAETVEMQVGKGRFQLREKNIAALRDVNNRVKL